MKTVRDQSILVANTFNQISSTFPAEINAMEKVQPPV